MDLVPVVIEVGKVEWGPHILFALDEQPLRFSNLLHRLNRQSETPVHTSTFDSNLKRLEQLHLIARDGMYRLTASGKRVTTLLRNASTDERTQVPSPDHDPQEPPRDSPE